MQPETPDSPPEAAVIRLAREAMDMTAIAAAEASRTADDKGVSVVYWRDVERGYGGRRGQRVPVRASARALAAMARAVRVTPAQLTRAGREDAARVLEEILRREKLPAPPAAPLPAPRREPAEDDGPALRPYVQSVLRDLYAAAAAMPHLRAMLPQMRPGQELPDLEAVPEVAHLIERVPGKHAFPLAHEAATWDTDLLSAAEKARAIARWRRLAAEYEARERNVILGRT